MNKIVLGLSSLIMFAPVLVCAQTYQLGQNGSIIRLVDGALIPPDARNSDYQRYLLWQAQGNTPEAAATLSLADQATIAEQSGLTITLFGTLTLAATLFPTDSATQIKLSAIATTLATTGSFPGGSSTYQMKDSSGVWHTFTKTQWAAVAGAIASYVAACQLIVDGNPNGVTVLPAATVSLTV